VSSGGEHRLQQDAVGVFGIVFFVLAAAAPLAAVAGAAPVIFGTAHSTGGPGVFVLSGSVLLLFSVGYAAMSRFISGPGGFAVYVARAFGRRAGISASFVAVLAYNAIGLAQYGLLGYLAHPLFHDKLGITLPWWAWAFAFMAVVAFLGYRNIDLSAKVLGVLMVGEVATILLMNVFVTAKGGKSGLTLTGFSLSHVFGGAAGITILFAFASYVGFEATTIYGEEARDRLRTIPKATYVAVLFIGLFYTFTYFALQVGYGDNHVVSAASANPATFLFDLNTRFVGHVTTDIMNWLVMTSVFACILSFHNTITRYLFALGRDGVLHEKLGSSHETHLSPHVASVIQSIIGFLVVGAFVVLNGDPYAQLYSWFVGLGTVGVLTLCTAASVAVIGFLRSGGRDTRLWHSLIAPVLATVGLGTTVYLSIRNFSTLTGATSELPKLLWVLVPVAAATGVIVASARRARSPGHALGAARLDDDVLGPEAPKPDLATLGRIV
jgi:amino acid transporter